MSKKYLSVSVVNATPMTRQEYNTFRGWTVPSDENPEDEGYLIEALGAPASNHPDFNGYIDWVTAEQLEAECIAIPEFPSEVVTCDICGEGDTYKEVAVHAYSSGVKTVVHACIHDNCTACGVETLCFDVQSRTTVID